jgi:hypothetical protein
MPQFSPTNHSPEKGETARETADVIPLCDEDQAMTRKFQIATELTFQQATDLLDWLEVHGLQSHDITTTKTGHLTIRWVA